METTKIIKNIESQIEKVKSTKTNIEEGRQLIANSCKKLYNFIEDTLYNKYGSEAMNDAFRDLLNGDFAEPYHCEMKKEKFELYAKIYIQTIK